MVKPKVIPMDVAKPDLNPNWLFFKTRIKSGLRAHHGET